MDVWCVHLCSCINGGGLVGSFFWVADSERAAALHRVAVGFGTVRRAQPDIYIHLYILEYIQNTNRSTTTKQEQNVRIAKNLSLGRSFATFYFGTMTTHKGLTDLFFECCSIHTCFRLGPGLFTLQDHNTGVVQTLFVSSGT
jgi:hypothetical protein